MDVNYNNFLSINEVLADVLVALNDENMRMLTPGFYRAQVKYGLDELGFDTFFLDQVVDLPVPDDLRVPMPAGVYNMKSMHLYTGEPCDVRYMDNVYWKKGFVTMGARNGYTANRVEGNITDPYIKTTYLRSGRYWFNVQNGIIMLSDSCAAYDYIRIVYSGIPSKSLDEVRMIPPEVRKALVLWVIEKCSSYLKSQSPMFRQLQLDAANQLDEYGFNGAWHEAKRRLYTLDKKKLRDSLIYNAEMNF